MKKGWALGVGGWEYRSFRKSVAVIFLALAAAHAAPKSWYGTPSPELQQELMDFVERADVGGQLGFAVYSVKHQRFEATYNDSELLVPASTLKLIVTAAALDAFPVNTYPTTTLEVSGMRRGRTLRGTLRVNGGGDPNISDRFFPDAVTPLRVWADSLKAMGIDTVRGQITVSDTFFTGPHKPVAWPARHFNTWYGAEISALSFNDNCFEIFVEPGAKGAPARVRVEPDVGYVTVINETRTGAGGANRVSLSQRAGETTVILTGTIGVNAGARKWLLPARNPPAYFRRGFITALQDGGIVFIDDRATGQTNARLRSFRLTTAPMASMVDEINQRSQNLHAEMLLRHLGKRVRGDGSVEGGIAAEKDFIARIGLDPAAFDLHDGCGLSNRNRVRTRELTLLLAHMARHRFADDYIASLASPGLDGATGKRLRNYADAGLVRYKTGSLSGVAGLAGYAFAADGDTLAVVLLLNGYPAPAAAASALLDSLMIRTALWVNKERPAAAEAYKLLAQARSQSIAPLNFTERLRFFSKTFEGTPYFLGPTGEGRYGAIDPKPIVDFTQFDCVTYMESVLGLALARHAPDLIPAILPIRYHGDTIGYANRNHYFPGEWIANNPGRFRVLQIPGDTVLTKRLDRSKLLAAKGLTGNDIQAKLRYMPYEKALKLAQKWNLGNRFLGVAFMSSREGLDATHTGFVDASSGKPLLRHASQLQGRVAEQDFAEYLESRRGKVSGVLFFEFLPPVPGG